MSSARGEGEAKRRVKEGRSLAPSRPGAQAASNKDSNGIWRKQKQQGRSTASSRRIEPQKSIESVPDAVMDENGDMTANAIAVDEEENKCVRDLEEQLREREQQLVREREHQLVR